MKGKLGREGKVWGGSLQQIPNDGISQWQAPSLITGSGLPFQPYVLFTVGCAPLHGFNTAFCDFPAKVNTLSVKTLLSGTDT